MSLKFYLNPNPLTPDPNSLSARVVSNRVLDTEAVIKEMLRRGTTVTEADVNAVLKVMFEVITDELAEGNSVNLPLANIRPGIIGNFNGVTDTFDASRHTKRASLTAGMMLLQKMALASVEKVARPPVSPKLDQFTDVSSGLSDSTLTPGGIGRLVGKSLKFDMANPLEGVFFVDAAGVEVKAAAFENRTENKLVFAIPQTLAPGSYILQVRKGYGTTNITVRTGALNSSLTVV